MVAGGQVPVVARADRCTDERRTVHRQAGSSEWCHRGCCQNDHHSLVLLRFSWCSFFSCDAPFFSFFFTIFRSLETFAPSLVVETEQCVLRIDLSIEFVPFFLLSTGTYG